MKSGNSISNAIVIDAQDTITGVTEEHEYIDRLCRELQTGIQAIEQKLLIENGRQYDLFTLNMEDGNERVLYFDISIFYGKT